MQTKIFMSIHTLSYSLKQLWGSSYEIHFYMCRNRGQERLSDFPAATEAVRGRQGCYETQACLFSKPLLLLLSPPAFLFLFLIRKMRQTYSIFIFQSSLTYMVSLIWWSPPLWMIEKDNDLFSVIQVWE